MREKVLAALTLYAEGGTIRKARAAHKVSAQQFYDALEADPDLVARYRFIQKSRADMFADEVLELAEEGAATGADPRHVRVAADVKLKLASFYDRPRFGEKIGVELEAGPNLAEALQAARQRVPLPQCDLAQVTDVEYRALPSPAHDDATDKQSDAKPAAPDPKGIFE